MDFHIENEFLRVSAKSFGAELTSIYGKRSNKEFLWSASPEFWPRHAPVLFPIVGRLKDNEYSFYGRKYQLPQHGFARDLEFGFYEKSLEKISLVLRSTQETKQVYPFDFELKLNYQLTENKLITTYEVTNVGNEEMYFSIGAHPAFALDDAIDNYSIRFEKVEPHLKRTKLNAGLLDFQEPFQLQEGNILHLSESLFEDDAIVFEKMNSEKLTLYHIDTKVLSMDFPGFPFYGIWKKANAPFLCLEPWFGIADDANYSGDFRQKKGISNLISGERRQLKFGLEFYQ